MEQISINPEEMQWEEIAGFPQGTRISVLRRDQDGRIRTMLMKLGNDLAWEAIRTQLTSNSWSWKEKSRVVQRPIAKGPIGSFRSGVHMSHGDPIRVQSCWWCGTEEDGVHNTRESTGPRSLVQKGAAALMRKQSR